jgi:DNA-binding Lrp family transcriptional regulator
LHRPDNLDYQIGREIGGNGFFQWNVRLSYSAIAKRIGADEETVRYRVKRAQQSGALQKIELVLNPHSIGQEAAGIEVESSSEEKKTPETISQMKLVDGVVFVLDFEGKILRAVMFYESEKSLNRRLGLISSIFGGAKVSSGPNTFPPVRHELSRTDWIILKAIRKDPRNSLSNIANETRLSSRTIRRRLELMTEANVFFLVLVPDLKKFQV